MKTLITIIILTAMILADNNDTDTTVSSYNVIDVIDVIDTVQTPEPEPEQPQPQTPPEIRRPRTQEELGRMSSEELFRLAFGRAAPERPRSMLVRLMADNQRFGEIEIVYEADFSSFNFTSPRLARHLDDILLPAARPLVGDTVGYFNSAVLTSAGYVVRLNERTFDLVIISPPESKALQRTNLMGGHRQEPRGAEISPAHVSFYMNYRLTDRLTYRIYDYVPADGRGRVEDYKRDPAQLFLDGALVSLGWALEGSAWVIEPREGENFTWENFRRGDIRLVRDLIPWNARFTAGDIDLSTEILDGEMIGGVRYEYNGWFFNHDPRGKNNSVTFFMPRPGTVELYTNGRYTDRFHLTAGHHEISGFGGEVGRNRVRLVLRTDDGGTEEIPFEFVQSNPSNVPQGDVRYSIAAGIRRDWAVAAPASFEYHVEETAMSAYFLYGLHHALSMGLAGQASPYNGRAGGQILWSMGDWGGMDMRASVNYVGFQRFGNRADVSYTANLDGAVKRLNNLLPWARVPAPRTTLSVRGYRQSALYGVGLFDSAGLHNDGLHLAGVSGNLGFRLFRGNISATAARNYAAADAGYELTDYSYGARAVQTINKVSVSASAGVNVRGETRTPYFSLNSNYAIGAGARVGRRHRFSVGSNVSVRSDYVFEDETRPDSAGAIAEFDSDWAWSANAGWRWSNGGSNTGGRQHSATLLWSSLLDNLTPGFSTSLHHTYNRAQLSANYGFTYLDHPMSTYRLQAHNMNAVFSGSFMFADGLWAFGRPAHGGFILADARRHLKGANIHVDRSHHARQDFSRSGLLGAAYKNRTMDYSPTQMTLTLTDAPIGAMLTNNQFYVQGGYKQGYALRVGDRASVLMRVRFTLDDRPLSHVNATIEQEDDTRGDFGRRVTFTGSNGILQVSDLIPGRTYRIRFGQATNIEDVLIEIPRHADPIFELPDIEVVRR